MPAGATALAGIRRLLVKRFANGYPYTVAGIAPRGFHGTEIFYWAEIWVPMTMQPQIEGRSWLEFRGVFNVALMGRLKPGVNVEQAEANLNIIAAQLGREHSVNEGMRLTLSPPGLLGSTGREPVRAFGTAVMLLAGLLLLAACANLAVLLTSRAADRERELAIRASIGAGRGRIVRQLLTESVALSTFGGGAGLAVAVALLRGLSQWRAPLEFPVQFDVSADWRVYIFAFAAAISTGMLFGLGPARRAWKADPGLSLKGAPQLAAARRWAGRDMLLPLQVALCCVLVVASLVAVRGLIRSFQTPLGFVPGGAAVIGYDVGLAGYSEAQGRVLQRRALEEVSQLPGVESCAYANSFPLSIDQSRTTVYREDLIDLRPKNGAAPTDYSVSPGYFRAVGTRLLEGRDFTWQDDSTSPRVAIVNRTLARKLYGPANVLGKRCRLGTMHLWQIVGVVEDGKYQSVTEPPGPALFLPILQNYSSTVVLLARTHRPEPELAADMRQQMSQLDPHLAIYSVGGLRQMLGFVYLPMHAAVITLGAFGVLAVMLSITGIYGLATYTVSRRSREIGIRVAVGAGPGRVLQSIFGRIGASVASGAVGGLVLGIAGARVMESIVYQATSRDPVVILASVATIALVALASALGPARRALRVDPVQCLRQE